MISLNWYLDCGGVCPQDYNPVCGSDGQTYGNQCELEVASCNSFGTIRIVSNGPCISEDRSVGKFIQGAILSKKCVNIFNKGLLLNKNKC